jgi:hypothetical protein
MRKVLEPASGSVMAKTRMVLPATTEGTMSRFCCSVPFLRMQAVSMAVTSMREGEKPRAQMSSKPRVRATRPELLPPYSSGTRAPRRPMSANSCQSS